MSREEIQDLYEAAMIAQASGIDVSQDLIHLAAKMAVETEGEESDEPRGG